MINDKDKSVSNYVKYTGAAFQMLVIIGVFTFIGYKVDEHNQIDNFLFTAILGILGVAVSLYQLVRSLNKK